MRTCFLLIREPVHGLLIGPTRTIQGNGFSISFPPRTFKNGDFFVNFRRTNLRVSFQFLGKVFSTASRREETTLTKGNGKKIKKKENGRHSPSRMRQYGERERATLAYFRTIDSNKTVCRRKSAKFCRNKLVISSILAELRARS